MNADEQVCLCLIRDCRACFERDEGIVVAGIDDIGPKPLLQQFAQSQCHVEDNVLFLNAAGSERTGVMPTVAGINDDAADLQSKCADQGPLAS